MPWNPLTHVYILDDKFGYQSAEAIRQNLVALVSRRSGRFLGGSRRLPNDLCVTHNGQLKAKSFSLGPTDVIDAIDIEIDGTNQSGVTYQARVEVRVSNPRLTVTPKIRNVTDATDAGVGSACSASALDYSGTNQKQTIALTIPTGVKKYRLQFTLSSVGYECWLTGEIESFATV